jgi:iron complex outermembrane receptor protein
MNKKLLFNYCLTASLLGALSPVRAVDAVAADTQTSAGQPEEVPEIVVTAQKREQRLGDVPISVTAASGDQLARQGIVSVGDLQKIVPGFTYALSSYGAPIYTLRGIGFYSASIAVAPTVSIYVDQVPLPFSRMAEGATLDIERVEVLKGPQGTLFGQNSTGGAINYIAAKPTNEFHAGGDITYGRYNEVDLDGFLSGPVSDTVEARLAVRTESRDGWQQNYVSPPVGTPNSITVSKNGVRNFNAARLLVDWHPSNNMKWEFNLNGWKDRSDSQASQKIAYAELTPGGYPGAPGSPNLQAQLAAYPNAPHDNTTAGFDPGISFRRNDGFYQGSARGDITLTPKITLTSITAFSHLNVFGPTDMDGTTLSDERVTVLGNVTSMSQEIRLSGVSMNNDELKWVVGGNYEYDDSKTNQLVNIGGSNSGLGPLRFYDFNLVHNDKVHTAAVFGDLEYEIVDSLTAQAAVRYTHRNDAFSGCGQDPGDGLIGTAFSVISSQLSGSPTSIAPGSCVTLGSNFKPIVPIVRQSLDEDNVSYRAGLSWKVTPATLLYVNTTKGYKAGAFESLPAVVASEFAPDRQESVVAYELGAKSFLLNRRLEVDGAIFHYDYKHKQIDGYINEPIFGVLPALVSIPKSRVEGVELNAAWRPAEGVAINIGGTYLDSRVTNDFDVAGAFGGTVNVNGDPFPDTPKWQITSDAQYEFPLNAKYNGYVGGGLSYHGASTGTFGGGPLFDIASYTLLDLRTGVETSDGRWRVELWGHNVTNRYYWSSVQHVEDTVDRVTGMPATFGITFSARM